MEDEYTDEQSYDQTGQYADEGYQEPATEDESIPDINDLGDAFVAMRQAKQEESQGSLEGNQESTQYYMEQQQQRGSVQSGTVTDSFEGADWNTSAKSWAESVNRAALNAARQDERITKLKPIQVENLMSKTEDGDVIYINPDDSEAKRNGYNYRGFSRKEAEDWCSSYNGWVKRQQQEVVKEYQKKIAEEAAPNLRLIQFGPTYEKMSASAREMIEDIIAPYAILGNDGVPVGYNCDLNQAARMAESLASKYGRQQQQQRQPQQQQVRPSGPALDMKSSGSGQAKTFKEPTNMEEAMEYIRQQNVAESKKGKK